MFRFCSECSGEEKRGDTWRRAIRAIDPLKTTREKIDQSELPNSPLSKNDSPPDPSKHKKLDDAVRFGKMFAEDAAKQLTDDVNRGDISPSQYKQRVAALSQAKSVKEMTDVSASETRDFIAIEKILKNAPPEDKRRSF